MSRETKQERIVRGIFEQVSEHLHELKTINANPTSKELDVERWCQSVLRNCLGYTSTNGFTISAQESRGKMRPDLVLHKDGKPIFVVEIKKLGYDLNRSNFRSGKVQLNEYLQTIGGVRWGILCNGFEWRLYDFGDPENPGIEVISFDLRNDSDELDLGKRGVEDNCWNLLDLHESTHSSQVWNELSKEATIFSPETLARAILSVDAVKYIAKTIRGEFDYKVNLEILGDKICSLLETGLDDSVNGWNEVKQTELHKYVKSQKRLNRRKSKAKTPEAQTQMMTPEQSAPIEGENEPVELTKPKGEVA
jgi:hypothetical protein